MSNLDNGFKNAQRMYDQQEPPEEDGEMGDFETIWVGNLRLILREEPGNCGVDVCMGKSSFTLCSIHDDGTIELSPTKRFTIKCAKNVYAPREEEF